MRCSEVSARIKAFIDGELGRADQEMIGRHIETCPDCSKAYRGTRRITEAVAGLEQAAAPQGFTERVMAAIGAEATAPVARPTTRKKWVLRVAAAAVAVGLAIGAAVVGTQINQPESLTAVEMRAKMPKPVAARPGQVSRSRVKIYDPKEPHRYIVIDTWAEPGGETGPGDEPQPKRFKEEARDEDGHLVTQRIVNDGRVWTARPRIGLARIRPVQEGEFFGASVFGSDFFFGTSGGAQQDPKDARQSPLIRALSSSGKFAFVGESRVGKYDANVFEWTMPFEVRVEKSGDTFQAVPVESWANRFHVDKQAGMVRRVETFSISEKGSRMLTSRMDFYQSEVIKEEDVPTDLFEVPADFKGVVEQADMPDAGLGLSWDSRGPAIQVVLEQTPFAVYGLKNNPLGLKFLNIEHLASDSVQHRDVVTLNYVAESGGVNMAIGRDLPLSQYLWPFENSSAAVLKTNQTVRLKYGERDQVNVEVYDYEPMNAGDMMNARLVKTAVGDVDIILASHTMGPLSMLDQGSPQEIRNRKPLSEKAMLELVKHLARVSLDDSSFLKSMEKEFAEASRLLIASAGESARRKTALRTLKNMRFPVYGLKTDGSGLTLLNFSDQGRATVMSNYVGLDKEVWIATGVEQPGVDIKENIYIAEIDRMKDKKPVTVEIDGRKLKGTLIFSKDIENLFIWTTSFRGLDLGIGATGHSEKEFLGLLKRIVPLDKRTLEGQMKEQAEQMEILPEETVPRPGPEAAK